MRESQCGRSSARKGSVTRDEAGQRREWGQSARLCVTDVPVFILRAMGSRGQISSKRVI